MSTVIAVTQFAAPTSTGNQDITTTDLGGLTPKGVLFIYSSAIANNSLVDDVILGYGYYGDNGAGYCGYTWHEHGQSRTDTDANYSDNADDAVIRLGAAGSTGVEATFVQWLTNGVRLNFGTVYTEANLITAIFFAGTGVDAKSYRWNSLSATNTDITAIGFEANAVLQFSAYDYSDGGIMLGITNNETTDVNCIAWLREDDNQADGAAYVQIEDDTSHREVMSSGSGYLGSFDSQGFTDYNVNRSYVVGSLSLLVDTATYVGIIDTPTSVGTQGYTIGFKPQFLMIVGVHASALNTTTYLGTFGIGVADANGNEYSVAMQSEYGAATSNTSCITDSKIMNLPDDAGATSFVVTLSSFDTNGFTLNFANTDTGTARKWLVFAIEEEGPPPDVSIPVLSNHQYRRRYV